MEQWQLVGLISRRSRVRVPPPLLVGVGMVKRRSLTRALSPRGAGGTRTDPATPLAWPCANRRGRRLGAREVETLTPDTAAGRLGYARGAAGEPVVATRRWPPTKSRHRGAPGEVYTPPGIASPARPGQPRPVPRPGARHGAVLSLGMTPPNTGLRRRTGGGQRVAPPVGAGREP